jgi:hypothetical protein
VKSCLLQLLVFLVLLPVVFALPPVGFAVFCFIACTTYFWQKDRP